MCVKPSWKTLQETWDREAYCVKPSGGGGNFTVQDGGKEWDQKKRGCQMPAVLHS